MILWIIFIALEILRNYYLIEVKKSRPIYIQSFIIRGLASIFHGVYLDVQNMREFTPILAFQVITFWWLFDIGLNLLRRKIWNYRGQNSGWLDPLPDNVYWILKFVVTGIGIWLLIYNL